MNSEMKNDILSIILDIANNVRWNRFVNEHYLHHYFTYCLCKKNYKVDITKERGEFRVHPEWPTFRKEDKEEKINIPYRLYSNKGIAKSSEKGSCGHFDFTIGDYNQPDIGIEFKWIYGWDKAEMRFDFLKCMDGAIPFKTTISYNVIVREKELLLKGKKLRFENSINDALKKARGHLKDNNSLYKKSERDVYIIITEVGKDKNGKSMKRNWYFDKSLDSFIEKPVPLQLPQ